MSVTVSLELWPHQWIALPIVEGANFVLTPSAWCEIAYTDTPEPPARGVVGHRCSAGADVRRIASGYVWVRGSGRVALTPLGASGTIDGATGLIGG